MEIFSDALRNVLRRRLRSLLAVIGVAVGIFSFLLLGAMSNHFRKLSSHFNDIFQNRVFVAEKPTFWAGGGILSQAKQKKVEKVRGVKAAVPLLISRFNTETMVVMGIPKVVVGVPPSYLDKIAGGFKLLSGAKDISSPGTVLLGFDAASDMNARAGSEIKIEGNVFKVTGVLQKTGGIIDGQVIIPLKDAQETFFRKGLITSVLVIPEKGVSPEKMAEDIMSQVQGVQAIPPSRFRRQVRQSLALWNGLTGGAALMACLTGALCVIIVMMTAVTERTTEIGIKKALGAEKTYIAMEFIAESVLVIIPGWLVGSVASLIFSKLAGMYLKSTGTNFFEPTLPLFALALAGGLAVGVISGIIPAVRAVNVNPVKALKVRY